MIDPDRVKEAESILAYEIKKLEKYNQCNKLMHESYQEKQERAYKTLLDLANAYLKGEWGISEEEIAYFLKHEWKELSCIDECYMERLAKALSGKIPKDELARLKEEVKRYREALEKIATARFTGNGLQDIACTALDYKIKKPKPCFYCDRLTNNESD